MPLLDDMIDIAELGPVSLGQREGLELLGLHEPLTTLDRFVTQACEFVDKNADQETRRAIKSEPEKVYQEPEVAIKLLYSGIKGIHKSVLKIQLRPSGKRTTLTSYMNPLQTLRDSNERAQEYCDTCKEDPCHFHFSTPHFTNMSNGISHLRQDSPLTDILKFIQTVFTNGALYYWGAYFDFRNLVADEWTEPSYKNMGKAAYDVLDLIQQVAENCTTSRFTKKLMVGYKASGIASFTIFEEVYHQLLRGKEKFLKEKEPEVRNRVDLLLAAALSRIPPQQLLDAESMFTYRQIRKQEFKTILQEKGAKHYLAIRSKEEDLTTQFAKTVCELSNRHAIRTYTTLALSCVDEESPHPFNRKLLSQITQPGFAPLWQQATREGWHTTLVTRLQHHTIGPQLLATLTTTQGKDALTLLEDPAFVTYIESGGSVNQDFDLLILLRTINTTLYSRIYKEVPSGNRIFLEKLTIIAPYIPSSEVDAIPLGEETRRIILESELSATTAEDILYTLRHTTESSKARAEYTGEAIGFCGWFRAYNRGKRLHKREQGRSPTLKPHNGTGKKKESTQEEDPLRFTPTPATQTREAYLKRQLRRFAEKEEVSPEALEALIDYGLGLLTSKRFVGGIYGPQRHVIDNTYRVIGQQHHEDILKGIEILSKQDAILVQTGTNKRDRCISINPSLNKIPAEGLREYIIYRMHGK